MANSPAPENHPDDLPLPAKEFIDEYYDIFELVFFRRPTANDFFKGDPKIEFEALEDVFRHPNPEYRRRLAFDHLKAVLTTLQLNSLLALDERVKRLEAEGGVPLD